MSDADHAEAILQKAETDLRALEGMQASADPSQFADEVFGFHAQQAVEKSLKAWLAKLGAVYPKSHDLELLFQELGDRGVATAAFDDLIELNPFAVQFRYETVEDDDPPLSRAELIAEVQRLITRVRSEVRK